MPTNVKWLFHQRIWLHPFNYRACSSTVWKMTVYYKLRWQKVLPVIVDCKDTGLTGLTLKQDFLGKKILHFLCSSPNTKTEKLINCCVLLFEIPWCISTEITWRWLFQRIQTVQSKAFLSFLCSDHKMFRQQHKDSGFEVMHDCITSGPAFS